MNLKVDGAYTLVAGVKVNITLKEAARLLKEHSDTFTSGLADGSLVISVKPAEIVDGEQEHA